jgi:HEPN domain-containing protein/predicted nucleotidyltransferase
MELKMKIINLPEKKRAELFSIVNIIKEIAPAEIIILFGSYARNEWIEEKYDNEHYRYQSDFDILVIVDTKSQHSQAKFERNIEYRIEQDTNIDTPTSIIVHDIDYINCRLNKAQYFFTDIKKEGIILYNSKKYALSKTKKLLSKERKKLAQEDFDYWFGNANKFYETFFFNFEKGYYSHAAFELHQVVERIYGGILLVFTRYKPNTHDLAILRKLTNSLDNRFIRIFPLEDPENLRLFKLLRKAYVDARYKPSYTVTRDELMQLSKQVEELKKIGKLVCEEKINSFT